MFAAAMLAALSAPAFAQPYPGTTAAPRTTDPAALRALTASREVLERMRAGFSAENGGDWKTARALFARAIALEPREPQGSTAYYDLGLAQAKLGEYADAATSFQAAIDRDPGFLAARANLVTVYLQQNDLTRARHAADAFVAAAPVSARALFSRGFVAIEQNDAPRALADFRELTSRDPSYAVAHYELALAESELGSFADAERELRDALVLAPGYARAHLELGVVLLREGKREEARTTFDDVANNGGDSGLRTLAASMRDSIGH